MGVMRIAARRVLSVVFVLVFVVGGGVLGGASASAEVIHNFKFSFNGSEAPSGAFGGGLAAVAVDQASGDVYVAEYNREVIERFDSAGKYLGLITLSVGEEKGLAVDNSGGPNNGDLYVGLGGVVDRFDSSGKLLYELNGSGTLAGSFHATGVAVDSTGKLYVADSENDVIDEFSTSGAYVGQIASPEILNPGTIAVDSSGDVYVTNFTQSVVKLEPGGGSSVVDANKALAVAVDPATGNVFVSENYYPAPGLIAEYDSAGTRLGAFGGEQVSSVVLGLAVRGATGEVYASDNNDHDHVVDVFGPGIVIPDVVSEAASGVTPHGVTLHGTVDPDGLPVSSCMFEYGPTTAYGTTVSCTPSPGSGTSPVPVSATVTGLQPDTTYHFRLAASNANGVNHGADLTVTTTGPPRVDGESTSGVTRTGATLEGQVDPFGFATTYRFEYGTSTAYGTSIPVPDGSIGSGMIDVPVSQQISGLRSGVTYHYRVVASSSEGTVDGPDQTVTTVPPVYIDAQYATNVASTSATIGAKVNPLGTETEYRLEIGTSTSYGQTYTGNTGETNGEVLIVRHLQELKASTVYHYRVVLQNVFGTVEGQDHTFTIQGVGSALALPDGRAWELVSPPDKKGAQIEQKGGSFDDKVEAAADGGAIMYETLDVLGEGAVSKTLPTQVVSMRGTDGWRTEDISLLAPLPPEGEEAGQVVSGIESYNLFSPDLSVGVAQQPDGPQIALAPEATERTPYLRTILACNASTESCYQPLVTPGDVEPASTKFGGNNNSDAVVVEGASPDLSHVVLSSPDALIPPAVREGLPDFELPNLYEWSGGRLRLVNVFPNGTSRPLASLGGRGASNGALHSVHAVSNDGRWIVWTYGSAGTELLFVRDMMQEKTVAVGGQHASFQSMSADGSRVFYTENGDLYELDTGTGVQSDLTAAHGAGESNAGVREVVMSLGEGATASSPTKASYLYFVATGVLAPGAVSGAYNLYVLHGSGAGQAITFIGALSHEDQRQDEGGYASSRASADGRYVAFMSNSSLTGYDNRDAVSGRPDEEVYLYDALSNHLACVSCNPTGARPVGVLDKGTNEESQTLLVDRGSMWRGHTLAGFIPNWDQFGAGNTLAWFYQADFLSDSGRVFFDSPDALVPQATNGLMNVYEFEPVGVGSCASGSVTFSPVSGGCVSLISDGTSAGESAFYDASESGDDAFFITSSKLVSEDYDTAYDVYDAHVCSASAPCRSAPVLPPPCTSGDSCKAAPSPQPEIFGPAPSATFSGAGNLAPEPVKPAAKAKAKPETRAQKLAKAIKACKQDKSKKKRAACEKKARRTYGRSE